MVLTLVSLGTSIKVSFLRMLRLLRVLRVLGYAKLEGLYRTFFIHQGLASVV